VAAPAAVSFQHVVKEYESSKRVIDNVSFDVARGAFVVLLGPSGCGKTTLLKTVNRLIEPTSGTILVNGADARSLEPTTLRRGIGYVIQQIGLFPHMRVAENVAVVPSLLGWPKDRIATRVEQMLDLVHLPAGQFGERFPAALSGGQQQMVAIGRAMMTRPRLILMDEPSLGLAPLVVTEILRSIRRLNIERGLTVLLIEQNAYAALLISQRAYVMEQGRIALEWSAEAVLTNERVKTLYLGKQVPVAPPPWTNSTGEGSDVRWPRTS